MDDQVVRSVARIGDLDRHVAADRDVERDGIEDVVTCDDLHDVEDAGVV